MEKVGNANHTIFENGKFTVRATKDAQLHMRVLLFKFTRPPAMSFELISIEIYVSGAISR